MRRTTSAGISFGCLALSAAMLTPRYLSRISAGTGTAEDVWRVALWGVLLLVSALFLVLAVRRSKSD